MARSMFIDDRLDKAVKCQRFKDIREIEAFLMTMATAGMFDESYVYNNTLLMNLLLVTSVPGTYLCDMGFNDDVTLVEKVVEFSKMYYQYKTDPSVYFHSLYEWTKNHTTEGNPQVIKLLDDLSNPLRIIKQ